MEGCSYKKDQEPNSIQNAVHFLLMVMKFLIMIWPEMLKLQRIFNGNMLRKQERGKKYVPIRIQKLKMPFWRVVGLTQKGQL